MPIHNHIAAVRTPDGKSFAPFRGALVAQGPIVLGSIASFFRASEEASDELWAKAVPLGTSIGDVVMPPKANPAGVEEEAGTELREDIQEKSEQFIEDRIASLDWQQMQELVAGILRAMGYRTTVAADGSDRGVDIFASPDGLGLQEPRIFVEVKHRNGSMGADELRKFLGGRQATVAST